MGIFDFFFGRKKKKKKEEKTAPSYDQETIAKAKSLMKDFVNGIDTSEYIGPSGFKSKKEVEAAAMVHLLRKTTGGSITAETLIEIIKDQYGLDDERSRLIIKDYEKVFSR